jgi:hypothetical protein
MDVFASFSEAIAAFIFLALIDCFVASILATTKKKSLATAFYI